MTSRAGAAPAPPALGLHALDLPDDHAGWVLHSQRARPGAVAEFAAALGWLVGAGRGPARRANCARALCGLLGRHLSGYLTPYKHGALIAAALALRYRWCPTVAEVDGEDLSVVLVGTGDRLGTPPPRPKRKKKIRNAALALRDPDRYC